MHALHQVSLPFDERLRAHALLLADRLVDVDSPLLVPVREVRPSSDGLDLVLEPPENVRALPELLRGVDLSPGQVVTLGLALCEALAALHDRGLTHGRLQVEDVLVRRGSEVLVTGYGVAGLLGSAGRPADDVRDLLGLLASADPGARHGWLTTVEAAVEAGEQDVRAVAPLLAEFGPRPQALPGAAPGGLPVPRPSGARHRAPRASGAGLRTLGLLLPAALGILLLAGWVGARSEPAAQADRPAPAAERPQPTSSPATQPAPAPPARPTDWRAVLTQLDVARAGILAAPDERRLTEVDASGSSAYADDLAAVRALATRRAVARGVRFDVRSVRVRSAGRWRADLEVVDTLRSHTIVGPEGQILERRPGRGTRTSLVTLVRVDEDWRISQVVPV